MSNDDASFSQDHGNLSSPLRSSRAPYPTQSLPSSDGADERRPLLSQAENDEVIVPSYSRTNNRELSPSGSLPSTGRRHKERKRSRTRWPTILALLFLGVVIAGILWFGFAVPTIMEEYVREAAMIEPVNLSVESFTPRGVQARVQATLKLDSSRVRRKKVADIGRLGTQIAKGIETGQADVNVYLPDHGNALIGVATIPALKVDVRDQHVNNVDMVVNMKLQDMTAIRQLANDWLDDKLESLRVRGIVSAPVRSGFINLGTQHIIHTLALEGQVLSDIPQL